MKKNICKREFLRRSLTLSAGVLCFPGRVLFEETEQAGVYKKLAMFQQETPRGVMCMICPNGCILKEGDLSTCRTKRVKNSKLYTMSYGNPCTVAVDPVEKKPLFHFLPGSRAFSIATAGCNLSCLNCQNWSISQTGPEKTRNYDLMPDKVVEEAINNNCRSIAYTYSEPTTFYEYAYDTALIAGKSGVRNIIKSNGYINPEPLKKLCTVMDAANIDLKSFNDLTYRKLSGGRLQPVLESLKIYRDSGVWLEITNLVVPSWTDNLDEIKRMCDWLSENGFNSVPLHFSRFYPLHKLEQLPPTPVETLKKAYGIALDAGLKFVYTGNTPGNDLSETICPQCKNPLVGRSGFRVVTNNIKNGKCPSCGTKIEGIWS